jgi:tetratricopeptide (TPR) repeat protein
MARPTLELSMIVKDGGASLDRCLASVAGLVDRIVIGDTGSTDETASVARQHGAEVFPVTWTEDFAAARNQVLAAARCDWILILDADEMLDRPQAAALLPELLTDPAIHAYTLERWDYVARQHGALLAASAEPNPGLIERARRYPGYVRSYHTRLFRRHAEVFYRGSVHEQVTTQLERLGLRREPAPLVLHHFGMVETTATDQARKQDLYYRLALETARTEPGNFDARLQLGVVELVEKGRPQAALTHLRAVIALRPEDGRGWLYHGLCLLRLNRMAEAKKSLDRAWQLGETNPALFDAMGDIYLLEEQYERALAAYRKAAATGGPSPVVEGKIGAVEVHLGRPEEGLERIQRALRSHPSPALAELLRFSQQAAARLLRPPPAAGR